MPVVILSEPTNFDLTEFLNKWPRGNAFFRKRKEPIKFNQNGLRPDVSPFGIFGAKGLLKPNLFFFFTLDYERNCTFKALRHLLPRVKNSVSVFKNSQ